MLKLSSSLIMRFIKGMLACSALLLLSTAFAKAESLAPTLKEQAGIHTKKCSAEILYSIKKVAVSSDFSWEKVIYYSIRINDLDGARDYARIRIPFNYYYTEIELEFANALGKKGIVQPVAHDAMQRRNVGNQDFYSEDSELVFSLPDVGPGSIIEFQFRVRSKKLPISTLFSDRSSIYWIQPTAAGESIRLDQVYRAEYEVDTPVNIPLFIRESGPGRSDYDSYHRKERAIHQWKWKKLPAIAIEKQMPLIETLRKSIHVSTSKDWKMIDAWAWNLVKDKIKTTSGIKTIASRLIGSGAERDEKIKAVYAYLQKNIRYVYAHLGRGGYEPHSAEEVIKKRYGDCKDQAILAVALLRAIGIEAYPALIATPRAGSSNMELASIMFDHMIVHIPQDVQGSPAMWMDTTSDMGLFPGISYQLADRSTLIVNGSGGKVSSITRSDLPTNSAELDLDFLLSRTGSLQVQMESKLSGSFEQNIRTWWKYDHEREEHLRKMVAGLYSISEKKMQVETQILNDNNLWEPVSIKATFHIKPEDGQKFAISGVSIAQAYNLFIGTGSLTSPDFRLNDWFDDNSYSVRINATFKSQLALYPMVVSSGGDVESRYLTVSQKGEQKDNEYKVYGELKLTPLNLSRKEYKNYYQVVNGLLQSAGIWAVSFMKSDGIEYVDEIKKKADSDESPKAKLKLARHYIEIGRFEDALKLAEAVVKTDQNNGEAWYLLGMAQGYAAMIEESANSFDHASKLGYKP